MKPLALLGVVLLPLVGALSACGSGGDTSAPAPTVVTVTRTVTASPTSTQTPSPTPTMTTSSVPSSPAPSSTLITSAPPSVDLSQPPLNYAEGVAHLAALTGPQDADRFQTPDGTYCVLKSPYIPPSCELKRGAIDEPDYCGNGPAGTRVGRIEFDDGKPKAICNSDTIREARPTRVKDGVAVTTSGGAVTCGVEAIGVTCLDTSTRQGFFLTPGDFNLLS